MLGANEPDYEYAPKGTLAELSDLRVENERLAQKMEAWWRESQGAKRRAERAEAEVERKDRLLADAAKKIEEQAARIELLRDEVECRELAECRSPQITDEVVERAAIQRFEQYESLTRSTGLSWDRLGWADVRDELNAMRVALESVWPESRTGRHQADYKPPFERDDERDDDR